MKGLLLKDWYMMKKYCRGHLLVAVVFIAGSFVGSDNMFLVSYPCLLYGMIPADLLAYDERSRWIQYSGTLPYTKAQIVSAKYLIGLFAQAAILIVTGVAQGIKMCMNGGFQLNDYTVLMLMVLIMATLCSSICLPFVFKLGVEKGRTASYVMCGFVLGGSMLTSGLFRGDLRGEIQPNALLLVLALVCFGIYILSWHLSIVFYKKREI